MNDQSPPKRVTRARATAQPDVGVKTARIATAASKARATRTVSTTRRKIGANDDTDVNSTESTQDIIEQQAPKPRGRPKKIVAPSPESDVDEIATEPTKPIRGRPRKTPVEAPVVQPARPRGRPRKVDTAQAGTAAAEPAVKTTRARATTASKVPGSKKAVQFEDTGKENIVPVLANEKGKQAEVATGLRAKPLRKAAVPAARATRGQPKVAAKSPLSPKKTAQLLSGKDEFSDDELAGTGKTPTKPLAMSPVKPPTGVFASNTSKKLDFSSSSKLGSSVMASPARRPPSSPFKAPVNTSPKGSSLGDCLLRSPVKLPVPVPKQMDSNTAMSSSLLRSPARRPQSPMKVAENGSPTKVRSKPVFDTNSSTRLSVPKFSGRLSSILPRDSDPALPDAEVEEEDLGDEMEIEQVDDPMVIDETVTVVGAAVEVDSASPTSSQPKTISKAFSLRDVDENPFQDSDSEDEATSTKPKDYGEYPVTPIPFTAIGKTPRTARSVKLSNNIVSLGFTPLAEQLSNWMPVSPEQREACGTETSPMNSEQGVAVSADVATPVHPSPARSSFFDDEMSVRDGMEVIEDEDFSPVELDEEDFALAHEADEMSLLDCDQTGDADHVNETTNGEMEDSQSTKVIQTEHVVSEPQDSSRSNETFSIEQRASNDAPADLVGTEAALSEASQEYADENAMPIDPALLALDAQAPVTPKPFTPKRVLKERVFHTISKVPLKAEAGSSPNKASPVKRSASVSKVPNQRPANTLSRSNTVISYSPSKKARSRSRSPQKAGADCVTPTKDGSDVWSSMGTPARTPRQDLNPALLRGAVVFVDVHTTEGADASGLFVELLTQMGARCVKSWSWNGSKDDGSKIGITHVVFKDGGRRTLERAKETGGVVSCVGVGWVLE